MSDSDDLEARIAELEAALEDAIEELECLVHLSLFTRREKLKAEIRKLKKVLSPF